MEEDCALRFHSVKELEQQKEAVCKVGSDFFVSISKICGNVGNDSDLVFCECCNKGFHKSCLKGQLPNEPTVSE